MNSEQPQWFQFAADNEGSATANLNNFNPLWTVRDQVEFNGHLINEKVVPCEWEENGALCNHSVKGKDFKSHLQLRHGIRSNSQFYQCRWHACRSRPMGNLSSLERHMKEQHVPVKWTCPICLNIFTRESTLVEHIQRTAGHPQLSVT